MVADNISVAEFAKQMDMSVDALLEHCNAAHMRVKDTLSPGQQKKVQTYCDELASRTVKKESNNKGDAMTAKTKAKADDQPSGKTKITLGKKVAPGSTEPKKEAVAESEEAQAPKKITLRRNTLSKLKVTGHHGDKKTVNIRVVKKRTYVKRSVIEEKQQAEDALKAEEQAKLDEAARVAEAEAKAIADAAAALAKKEQEKTKKTEVKATTATEAKEEKTPSEPEQPVLSEEELQKIAAKKALQEEEKERQKRKKKANRAHHDDAKKTKMGSRADFRAMAGRKDGGFHYQRQKTLRHRNKHVFQEPTEPQVKEVAIYNDIQVGELAKRMSVKAASVIKSLMKMGVMATINQTIDQDTAQLIVEEMGHTSTVVKEDLAEHKLIEALGGEASELKSRAPVVTIMGHVDHGKTTLLDYIRRTRVADKEAGGITQGIGAYHVETDKGMITFLDTPGHEAFTAMRARGAQVTDIVVLVVAADDGVMPQTIEAIEHAKAGNVLLIVAVNKMDKPEADAEKIKNDVSNHGVVPEDWGGDAMFVPLSAKTGDGVDALLDAILLQSEMMELSARTEGLAKGFVVEARLEKGRGIVASVLVQEGALKEGDIILAGLQTGRVRAMLDETGHRVSVAGPSMPIEVLGLSEMPEAGDEVIAVADEKSAREVSDLRRAKYRQEKFAKQQAANLDNMFDRMGKGAIDKLNIVLKADVQGSLEALSESLTRISNDEVEVDIIAKGVGGITGSDATLAQASNAILIGFNVRADAMARQIIANESLDVHYHSVIYNAIDEVKRAVLGMLAPAFKEKILGLAEVREVFRSSKLGAVAGCMVLEGTVQRNKPIRVLRNNVVVYEGELESLRRLKDDVAEVKKGVECGIGVKDYNDIQAKDQIEVFERVEVERTL
jgi:translation initiation factor IF-2